MDSGGVATMVAMMVGLLVWLFVCYWLAILFSGGDGIGAFVIGMVTFWVGFWPVVGVSSLVGLAIEED